MTGVPLRLGWEWAQNSIWSNTMLAFGDAGVAELLHMSEDGRGDEQPSRNQLASSLWRADGWCCWRTSGWVCV